MVIGEIECSSAHEFEPAHTKRQYNLSDEEKQHLMEERKKKTDRMKTEKCRLMSMMFLTGGFMIIEFVVGIYAGALALQADAMHMASDLIALIVGYWALSLSGKSSNDSYTFGWSRFETLGAMINSDRKSVV